MTWRMACAAWRVGLLLALGFFVSPGLTVQPAQSAGAAASAEELVAAALRAEIAGDNLVRDELLRKALEQDAQCAPARWQSEYVKVNDEWVSLEETERRWSADERFAEYTRLRDRCAGTAAGELALAKWCQARDLEIPARFHWLGVLRFQPQHQQALKILGMRWHDGKLLTHEQIAEALQEEAASNRAHRIRREQSREEAERRQEQRDALVDGWLKAVVQGGPDIGQSMRDALDRAGKGTGGLDSTIRDRCTQSRRRDEKDALLALSMKWIEIVDAWDDDWATRCLAANAIDHPFSDVRTFAADALRKRPQGEYVPGLVERIRFPLEASFFVEPYPRGVSYVVRYYREGPDVDTVDTVSRSRYSRGNPGALKPNQATRAQAFPRTVIAKAYRDAAEEQRAIRRRNAPIIERNRRIQHALARATGHDRELPYWRQWHDDYEQSRSDRLYDYYEMEKPHEEGSRQTKPVVRHYHDRTEYVSCFPRGTEVSTLTGFVPIEQIQLGDFVLSQDPDSGELAYKPVLEITTRSPAPMINIGLGSETITATRGHPFWVPDEGWKMAKEIEVGSAIHSTSGAVLVDGLEQTPEPKPWHDLPLNLVVADFHTYFVGRQRVLVHDNQLFIKDPTAALVPGLLPSP